MAVIKPNWKPNLLLPVQELIVASIPASVIILQANFVCAQADHVLFLGVGPRQVLCTPCDHQAIQWMCVLLLKGFQYLRICKIVPKC